MGAIQVYPLTQAKRKARQGWGQGLPDACLLWKKAVMLGRPAELQVS